MVLTDPISDLITRLRNGSKARHQMVELPSSRMKFQIAEILKREGFLGDVQLLNEKPQKKLRIRLRYLGKKEPIISEIRRVSKPGCRIYASLEDLDTWKNAIATTILSTSKGVMTDREAREAKVGGEVILRVE
ncbi:MAG: 30S ribosomal protein S8 [Pseudomonadota bacterium]